MSLKLTTRQLLTASLAVALAGTAVVGTGIANAAPGKTGKALPAVGSSASAQVITIAGTGFKNANGTVAVGTPMWFGGTAACAASGGTAASTTNVVSATKMTITLPATNPTFPTGKSVVDGKLCIPVTGSSPAAYVTVKYSVAKQPVKASSNDLSPAAGPLKGGQPFSVFADSTGPLRPDSQVLINGVPALGVKVARDGLSLTGTTPAGASAASSLPVVVRTAGFADVTLTGTYAYENAIKVSPSTAPAGTASNPQRLEVDGAGFKSSAYTGANEELTVYLFDGVTATACPHQVVSDTQLVCAVPNSLTSNAYRVIVADQDSITNATTLAAHSTDLTVVSSGSTYTVAPY